MVNAPVVTAFPHELPETMPMKPLAVTAAFPGPPWLLPASPTARSIKNWPAPEVLRNEPKRTKRKMNEAETPRGTPNIPSVRRYMNGASSSKEKPACARMPGI